MVARLRSHWRGTLLACLVLLAGAAWLWAAGEDADGDGMSDVYELFYGLDPNNPADAAVDSDADGLTNANEAVKSTDPFRADTDADGFMDPDDDAIGIVLDGAYERDRPPPAQLASAVRLLRDLRERYRIPARQVIGHRDVKARIVEASGLTFAGNTTVCPGDGAFDTIPALRLLSEPRRRPSSPPAGQRVATTTRR